MSSQSLANDIYFYMRFLYNFGVAICKYHAVQDLYIHSISAENFILQIFVKMSECHFWANIMLRQSSAQKSQGLRVVYSKKNQGYIFLFAGELVDRFLSYWPVKQIWRKIEVCM